MNHAASFLVVVLIVSVFASCFVVRYANSESGLVGHWKFDEGSGTIAFDSSGNGNNGTLNNGPTWVDGKSGKALSFDGVNDYVQILAHSSLDVTAAVTVEAWVYPRAYVDNFGQNSHIVSRTHDSGGHIYVLSIYPNSQKASYSVNPSPPQHPSTVDLQLNTWNHLAMTYDGSYVQFYMNGQFDSKYPLSGAIQTTTNRLTIGCNSYPVITYAFFNGIIDDVRIYSRALNQKEIQTDMGIARGPRMDNLSIFYYNSPTALFEALRNGEVDITNLVFDQTQKDIAFNDTSIQAAISPTNGIFQFDFNNNATTPTYRDWINPTAYKGFRKAIACLVNKTQIVFDICDYSYRIDTPIYRPKGNWWVDWSVSQFDSYGNFLGNYPYEYNSTVAAYYFDQSGFLEGNTSNPYYDPSYPSSAQKLRTHPETGQDLSPVIFYIRSDSGFGRLQAGRILRDNLRKLGIPVNSIEAGLQTCMQHVMIEGDYHLYTGGWSADVDLLLWLYSSEAITDEGPMPNYPQFRNSTYDEWIKKIEYPSSLEEAREAALKCQKILVEEAACVWLWTQSFIMGYRNIYGVANPRGGRIDNQWTFLTGRLSNLNSTTINYGLQSPPYSLNIITDYNSMSVSGCLDRIYDTLLSHNPYEVAPQNLGKTMPWMAEGWEVGAWESPYNPEENLTKLTFYLRSDVKWHDGVEFNSTDVEFTIEYLRQFGSTNDLYSLVADVHHVTIPDARTVVVYENVSNIWALDKIGTLPILPQHIFLDISNVTGYTPGASQGLPANQTLIGTGPWKYVFHNSSMLYLEANRDYFMETPPTAEVDFRYDWEMGSWVVDALDSTMLTEAFGSFGNNVPDAKWEPGCDIYRGDCKIDIFDLVTCAANLNTTWGVSEKRFLPPPSPDSIICIEHNNSILVGENFTVYVKLINLTMLSGVQFKLYYDNLKLECISLDVAQIFGSTTTFEARKDANHTKGYVWVSISSLGTLAQQVNGNATLATIVFNATKPSSSKLDLWNTKLVGLGALGATCQPILHKALDKSITVGVLTPAGTNVTVNPADNAQVTFTQTTEQGITTLNITQSPSPEFMSVLCYDIKTTATFTGEVTLASAYDDSGLSLEDEQSMRIWLWNESSMAWFDMTRIVDIEDNVVYGVTKHLSIFTVHNMLSIEGDMSQSGEITVGFPAVPPAPPEGFVALNYYEVQTTKIYTPPLILRIAYDNTLVNPEEEIFLSLWSWNESSTTWVDITTFVDTEDNAVYGVTRHLSIFTVHKVTPLPAGIAIVDASCSKTVISQGYDVEVSFIVENKGDFTLTFDIDVYCNTTILETDPVTLSPNAQTAMSYTWTTADWNKGNFTISVGNCLISWLFVTIPGDIDGDHKVDMRDIGVAARAFGSTPDDPKWSPNADINNDGRIDMRDLGIAARNFGQIWTP